MPVSWEARVKPELLDQRFFKTLELFASLVERHRYAVRYGLKVHITDGKRSSGGGAHQAGGGADLRGHALPWDDPQELRKLEIWLCGMWAEAVARAGYPPGKWGFGIYDDDKHIHVDVRPHTDSLLAAVWVKR